MQKKFLARRAYPIRYGYICGHGKLFFGTRFVTAFVIGAQKNFWLEGAPQFVIGAVTGILARRACSIRYKAQYKQNKLFLGKRGSSICHRGSYGHFGWKGLLNSL